MSYNLGTTNIVLLVTSTEQLAELNLSPNYTLIMKLDYVTYFEIDILYSLRQKLLKSALSSLTKSENMRNFFSCKTNNWFDDDTFIISSCDNQAELAEHELICCGFISVVA